jgi:hypothetical protein
MALGLNDFAVGKSVTWAIENLDFFGPKWHLLHSLPFQAQRPKVLIFRTLVMDVARIKIIMSRAI